MNTLELTADGLYAKFQERGIDSTRCNINIADSQYVCPTAKFVSVEFSPSWKTKSEEESLFYQSEVADCDDFADGCACYMRRLHRKTLDRPRSKSICFGEFWYTTQQGIAHAINFFFALLNEEWYLYFYEPQNCHITHLTQEEINSCTFIRV